MKAHYDSQENAIAIYFSAGDLRALETLCCAGMGVLAQVGVMEGLNWWNETMAPAVNSALDEVPTDKRASMADSKAAEARMSAIANSFGLSDV